MSKAYAFLGSLVFLAACQPPMNHDETGGAEKKMDSVQQVFATNSATVLSLLHDFENESMDHAKYYSDTMRMLETGFGSEQDTVGLEGLEGFHQGMWGAYDFHLVTDPLNLLPGVNPDTKMMDGSVRYYCQYKVTKPASDSTEEKSGLIRLYESFDFNKDGKIVYQQIYGDFGGLFGYLNSK